MTIYYLTVFVGSFVAGFVFFRFPMLGRLVAPYLATKFYRADDLLQAISPS